MSDDVEAKTYQMMLRRLRRDKAQMEQKQRRLQAGAERLAAMIASIEAKLEAARGGA